MNTSFMRLKHQVCGQSAIPPLRDRGGEERAGCGIQGGNLQHIFRASSKSRMLMFSSMRSFRTDFAVKQCLVGRSSAEQPGPRFCLLLANCRENRMLEQTIFPFRNGAQASG